MDILKAIKIRRSVRDFKQKAIPRKAIETLIEAARFAPTARNVQPWEFIIITDASMLEKIGGLAENGRFIAKSACCIALYCAETKYYLEDGSAATQNILLAAAAEGIASCWVAGDKKPYCSQISALLGAPASFKLVSLIALGYPQNKKSFYAALKRSRKEMMHWEKF
ncbi:MAG: nitroreductase family protein [Candidatus Omnitrophota bacterium]